MAIHKERARGPVACALLSGGGGLVSTIDDYAKFAHCLLHGGLCGSGSGSSASGGGSVSAYVSVSDRRVISSETLSLMHHNHLPVETPDLLSCSHDRGFTESIGPGIGFGLAVSVIIDPLTARGGAMSSIGEFGWGGVASTWFYVDPTKKIVSILFAQLIPSSKYPIRQQLRYLSHWVCAAI